MLDDDMPKSAIIGYRVLLVNLDCGIDFSNEEVGGVEADRAGQQPEGEYHQCCVAKVEECWNEVGDLQLSDEIKQRVNGNVEGRTARD